MIQRWWMIPIIFHEKPLNLTNNQTATRLLNTRKWLHISQQQLLEKEVAQVKLRSPKVPQPTWITMWFPSRTQWAKAIIIRWVLAVWRTRREEVTPQITNWIRIRQMWQAGFLLHTIRSFRKISTLWRPLLEIRTTKRWCRITIRRRVTRELITIHATSTTRDLRARISYINSITTIFISNRFTSRCQDSIIKFSKKTTMK